MGITYEKADDEVADTVAKAIKKWHPDLLKEKVTIDCLFAISDSGPAVKLHGYPCAAVVRKTTLKQRVKGWADAEIVIDAEQWQKFSTEERLALIDHEITHLEIVRDKFGACDRDDIDRPKLRLRLHDAQVGIFKCNIERHGENSLDGKIGNDFLDDFGQLLLWAKNPKAIG